MWVDSGIDLRARLDEQAHRLWVVETAEVVQWQHAALLSVQTGGRERYALSVIRAVDDSLSAVSE